MIAALAPRPVAGFDRVMGNAGPPLPTRDGHSEWGADCAGHDAKIDVDICVIAIPVRITGRATGPLDPANDIARRASQK